MGRVAVLMSRFPKITETFILYEMLELVRLGMDVQIYPLLREPATVVHPEVDALAGRLHYRPLLSGTILASNLRCFLRQPRLYVSVLAHLLRGTWRSANFLVGLLGIWPKSVHLGREMKRDGVRHIHAHFATHPTLAALIIHRLTGIPFSFTAHGSDLHVDQRMLAEKIAASEFAVMISRYNRDFVLRHCGAHLDPRLKVIFCGIDTTVFAPRPEHHRADRLRIVCVASLREVKGHRFLVAACARLRDASLPFLCDLVGEGPGRERIAAQIHAEGLDDCVRMIGDSPRPEVVRRMQEADVVVLPSVRTRRGNREGIPMTLMEAMACCTPVVASRLSGIPELVEHEKTGLLCPPGDADSLAAMLRRVWDDPRLAKRLGKAGRERIVKRFTLQRRARLLKETVEHSLRVASPE